MPKHIKYCIVYPIEFWRETKHWPWECSCCSCLLCATYF